MKLLALCTCERIIVDKQGSHSLINLMLNAEIQVPQQQQIPANAVAPNQWFIYSMWIPSPEDVGRKFEQWYQVYWPDGEKFTENSIEFTQPDESIHQVTLQVMGFPLGQPGRLRIITWLDQGGHRVSDIIETSILVKHLPQQTASSIPASTR